MKKITLFAMLSLFCMAFLSAQPLERRQSYNLDKDRVLYTVGYAHLDTEWNWDYPVTINEYIKNTMEENFRLFEKYPDYVFNFTGSRRYQFMKEYYPELYKKVVEYVKKGRWYVSGSSVDEGEVNISSSESVIRQVLYGNRFFNKEFGKVSVDYMLPDCFGFVANMPSIWNHCGLLGFSTQKLTWRSAAGVPFNVGVWNGPDGKGIIAALNAKDYGGDVVPRLDLDSTWNKRIQDNSDKYKFNFDYRYYGVGDEGGGPRENDVKNVVKSLNNANSKFKVVLTSSDQIYKDITPEMRKKLPTYSGDLLLIEHSAGSMTSQAYMKRANRKNEILAQSAEQIASAADWFGGISYPFEKLNNSWELLLGSQFHDILPGTSIPKAYEYAWNDEFVASNGFAAVLKNSVASISSKLNTLGEGKSVVVYNAVARDREDVVTAELAYESLPAEVKVFDQKGKLLPSQIVERKGKMLKLIFLAKVPSVGLAVFDVRETTEKAKANTTLIATNSSLENEYYQVKIAPNGDILSIIDKKNNKELLAKPARLEFQQEQPKEWPAWNMDWTDRQKAPFDFMDKDVKISIIEQGSVRVALEVTRKGQNSEITQIYSLAAGDAGKRLEVSNKIDWQSKEVSLKAAFPLAVSNEKATYNLGAGTIQRGNNNEVKFEVPSKEWFDLTDNSGKYGVSILEDCKYGSDKPDNNTLRLTLMFTPKAKWFLYQNTQDWGIHDVKYGIYGHSGDWNVAQTPWQAKFLNSPLIAFESAKHKGDAGKEVSLLNISSPQVGLMAFKKMEQSDYYVIRVNELSGTDLKSIKIKLPGKIVEAFEINGQEQKIGEVNFADGSLTFDITHYTIKSFAVKIQPAASPIAKTAQQSVTLPFNGDAMSTDENRDDGKFADRGWSSQFNYPAELIPNEIVSEDIRFKMGSREDGEKNMLACKGQTITLPAGVYNKMYILASATKDIEYTFTIDNQNNTLNIQNWTGYVGQFYNRKLTEDNLSVVSMKNPYSKQDNIAWFATHRHNSYPSKNEAYQFSYLFKYEVNIPMGAKTITLPSNENVKIFAITLAKSDNVDIKALQPLYDDFKNNKPFELRTK